MARTNHERVYTPEEKANIADEFSPALAEVLETVAPAWGNKVVVEAREAEVVTPSTLLKIRQLGDRGLLAVMHSFGKI